MKKALFIFAALAIMILSNVKMEACPPGWSGPVTAHYIWKCEWTYIFCYYLDPVTGEYSIQISYIEAKEPCWWYGTPEGSWEAIKRPLRDSILSQILKFLIASNIWDEIEIPQCPQDFCFWFVNEPACYFTGYEGYRHKQEPCPEKTPRPCNRAIVTICWDYKYDEYGEPTRDDYGNLIYITYTTRTWYPPLNDNSDPYRCPPLLYPTEPPCNDNCY